MRIEKIDVENRGFIGVVIAELSEHEIKVTDVTDNNMWSHNEWRNAIYNFGVWRGI
jgi:hypothetical protein